MANYNELITAMEAVIKQNGNEEITGVILQNTLRAMIQVLGAECQFAGVATPETTPGTPDYNVAYILGAGIYPNFGGSSVPNGNIAIASNTGIGGAWDVEQIALIPNGTIVTAMIADDAIKEDKIANNAVTENKINNGAVTENKIADNAVTENKINNGAVTENKINNGAVTENKIANNAVTENKIADDAVSTMKIADKNVTRDKLSDGIKEELDNKANIDGFYSTLGAGVAENLVGRGSVPAEYTFRTSGGDADLGSGTALIKKLMGRTLVFNQKVYNPTESGSNSNTDTRESFQPELWSITSGGIESARLQVIGTYATNKTNFAISAIATLTGSDAYGIRLKHDGATQNITLFQVGNLTYGHKFLVKCFINSCDISTVGGLSWGNHQVFDLTLMFGKGNEPSTVEEFESLFPLDYYAYNEGELLSVKATGIKTVGFNQWDEQSQSGYWDTSTGQHVDNNTWVCSKNPIRVFPNTTYYNTKDGYNFVAVYYDGNMNIVGYQDIGANAQFTMPSNAYYMHWYGSVNGFTYCCVNLSWSGYRNGEYEPYWESKLPIPITTMTGKLNGAGASIAMFADGLKSAGNAYDEITEDKAIKRIGAVTILNADITMLSPGLFQTFAMIPSSSLNVIAACNYGGDFWNNQEGLDNYIAGTSGNTYIYMKFTDSSSVEELKEKHGDIKIYYQLITPEEYILDAEQPMNYRVDDFGTEMELPQNDDEPVTAPIRYDVQYAMNAVDTLRRLPENYISKESFADFLAEFDSKVGAALNATIVSTMTFNSETQKYGFNITITPNNP